MLLEFYYINNFIFILTITYMKLTVYILCSYPTVYIYIYHMLFDWYETLHIGQDISGGSLLIVPTAFTQDNVLFWIWNQW